MNAKCRLLVITLLIFLGSFLKVCAQNLVPNPSFEDTVSCPLGGDQLYKAQNWYAFRFSPDYFHSCCTSANCVVGVPNNDFGFQYPHSGNAYAGMITYDLTGSPYREYLAVQLINPTISGQKYYLTCYLSWCGKPGFTIANNKFGIALSNTFYDSLNPYPITNNPIAFSDSIYSDSLTWSMVKLNFIAQGSYQYLILGNFFDDIQTDTVNLGQFNQHAYYYLDDVCLSSDSTYCDAFTGIYVPGSNSNEFVVYSYFESDDQYYLKFSEDNSDKLIEVYNIQGQLLKQVKTRSGTVKLSIKRSQIYFLRIYSNQSIYFTKII